MASADIPLEQGSLERLGIAIETDIPEDILKPSVIRALRFRQQAKLGYYTKDVEAFVQQQALSSVEWYIQRLHARDLDVHRLGEELDRLEVDMVNVRAQFEMAAASAPIAAAIAQAEQDPEVEAIVARAQQDQANLAAAYERIEALEADLAAAGNSVPVQDVAVETRIAELEGQLEASEEERELLAQRLEAAQGDVEPQDAEQLSAQVQELENYAVEQDQYIDLLLQRVDELEEQVAVTGDTAQAEPAEVLPAVEVSAPEPVDFETEAEAESEADADNYYAEDAADTFSEPEVEPLNDEELVQAGVVSQEPDDVQYEEEILPDEDEDASPYEAPQSEAPDRHEFNSEPRYVEVHGKLIQLPEGLSPEDFQ